jgi:membrane protein DedA with SNARE-associated domain
MSIELLSLEQIQEIARHYGYLAVFLGIALENAGIPLPGETMTVVGGFLAGNGDLNYWFLLGSAIAGAVLGDNCGYWVGKVGGWSFLVKAGSFFRVEEKRLETIREQFSQKAASAVFFGRFVTLLRIFAGPMAGICQMPYDRFFICNLGGATLWASVTITISYFLGQLIPLQEVLAWIAKLGVVALIIIIGLIAAPLIWEYWHKKHAAKD